MDLLTELTILVLAAFVGFEVISKVPNTLHTPLMSGTNAIHGIVLLGGLIVIGPADGFLEEALAVIAIAIPNAPTQFPRRAVVGEERNRSARMKQMIVTR